MPPRSGDQDGAHGRASGVMNSPADQEVYEVTAWQIAKRLLHSGRSLLVALIVFDVLVAWAAVALLAPEYLIGAAAPAVVVNALLIRRWNGSEN
jgi:hypothetical protein